MYSIIIKEKNNENNKYEIICPVLIQEGSIVKDKDIEYVVEKGWEISTDSVLNMNKVKETIINELNSFYFLNPVEDE